MMLGFLLSYGGTGLMLLGVFLPLAGLRHGRAGLAALLVVLFALGIAATGMVDLSAFSSRIGEFEDTRASGFSRFVAPFWLLAEQFRTESVQELLLGHGPGTAKTIVAEVWYTGSFATVWIKIFIEYGIVGGFILCCFWYPALGDQDVPAL